MGYLNERRKRPADDDDRPAPGGVRGRRQAPPFHIELLAFILLISGAGNETVARLLGFAGATLARFPKEREKLVARPIPNAIEELLRYEAPSPVQGAA